MSRQVNVAHDLSADNERGGNPYGSLGGEVASVLASARDAATEMREQAARYADTLLTGARQETHDLLSKAREDAERIVHDARGEAAKILLDARRQVLMLVETAQSRVEDTERAAEEAGRRHDEMLRLETELEAGLGQVLSSLEAELEALRARREQAPTPSVEADVARNGLADLLTSGAAALIEAEKQVLAHDDNIERKD